MQLKSKWSQRQPNCDHNPFKSNAKLLQLIIILLLSFNSNVISQVEAFCPRGCLCDELLLSTSCQQVSSISIVPMTLNPALRSLRLNQVPLSELGTSLSLYRQLSELDLTGNQLRSIRYENFNFKIAPHSLQLAQHQNHYHAGQLQHTQHSMRPQDDGNSTFSMMQHEQQEFVARNLKSVILNRVETSNSEEIGFHLRTLQLANNRIEQLGNYNPTESQHHQFNSFATNENPLEPSSSSVHLKGSQLEKLAPFLTLTRLEVLNLANNKLTRLHQHVFLGLIRLHELDLGGNELEFLDELAFVSLIELRSLKLGRNKLANQLLIMAKSLCRAPFKELSYLDLADNEQSASFRQHYQHQTTMTTTTISNNVVILPNHMFVCAPNLLELQLSKLQLRYIQVQAFDNLHSLERLNLSGNLLEQVPSDSLRQARELSKSLRVLDLSDTLIEFVNTNSFSSLKSLRLLAMNRMARLVSFDLSSFHFENRRPEQSAMPAKNSLELSKENSYLSNLLPSHLLSALMRDSQTQSEIQNLNSTAPTTSGSLNNENLIELQLRENPRLVSVHSSMSLGYPDSRLVFEQLKLLDLAGNTGLREIPLDNMLDWASRKVNSGLEINLSGGFSTGPVKLNCSSCKMSWLLEAARKQFNGLPSERQILLKNLELIECLEPAEIPLIRLLELEARLHSSGTQARPLDCSDRDSNSTSRFQHQQQQHQTQPTADLFNFQAHSRQQQVNLPTPISSDFPENGLRNSDHPTSINHPTLQGSSIVNERSTSPLSNVVLILSSSCLLLGLLVWLTVKFLLVSTGRATRAAAAAAAKWLSFGSASNESSRKSSSPTFSGILASSRAATLATCDNHAAQFGVGKPQAAAYLVASSDESCWSGANGARHFALMASQDVDAKAGTMLLRKGHMGKSSGNLFSRLASRLRVSRAGNAAGSSSAPLRWAPNAANHQASSGVTSGLLRNGPDEGPSMWLQQQQRHRNITNNCTDNNNQNAIACYADLNHRAVAISPQLTTSSNSGSGSSTSMLVTGSQLIRQPKKLARGGEITNYSNCPELLENYYAATATTNDACYQVATDRGNNGQERQLFEVKSGNNELQRVNKMTVFGRQGESIIAGAGMLHVAKMRVPSENMSLEALASCVTNTRNNNSASLNEQRADETMKPIAGKKTFATTTNEMGHCQFDGHIYVTLDRPIKHRKQHQEQQQSEFARQEQFHGQLECDASGQHESSAMGPDRGRCNEHGQLQFGQLGRVEQHGSPVATTATTTTNKARGCSGGKANPTESNDGLSNDDHKSFEWLEETTAKIAKNSHSKRRDDSQFKEPSKTNGKGSPAICNGKSSLVGETTIESDNNDNWQAGDSRRHAPRANNNVSVTSSSFMMNSKQQATVMERTNDYAAAIYNSKHDAASSLPNDDANHDSETENCDHNNDNDYVINGRFVGAQRTTKPGEKPSKPDDDNEADEHQNYHDNHFGRVGGISGGGGRARGAAGWSGNSTRRLRHRQQNCNDNGALKNTMETGSESDQRTTTSTNVCGNPNTMLFLLHNGQAENQSSPDAPQAAWPVSTTHHNRRQPDQTYQPVKQATTTTAASLARDQQGIYANQYYYYAANNSSGTSRNGAEIDQKRRLQRH